MKKTCISLALVLFYYLFSPGQEIMINSGLNKVSLLRFSNDGSLLVAAMDKQVKIIDYKKGIDIKILDVQSFLTEASAAISPDSKKLAVSDLKYLYVFDIETGKLDFKNDFNYKQLEFSKDGSTLYGLCHHNLIKYNTTSWASTKVLSGGSITAFALDTINETMTITENGNLSVWNLHTWAKLRDMSIRGSYDFNKIKYINNYQNIILSSDYDISIYDARTNILRAKFDSKGFSSYSPSKIVSFICSPDNNYAIFSDQALKTLQQIDLQTYTCTDLTTTYVKAFDASPIKNEFVIAEAPGWVNNFTPCAVEFGTDRIVRTFESDIVAVEEMCFSSDNTLLYSLMSDSKIHIWDLTSGKQIGKVDIHFYNKYKGSFFVHPDNNKAFTTYNDTLLIWDIKLNKLIDNKNIDDIGNWKVTEEKLFERKFILSDDGSKLIEFRGNHADIRGGFKDNGFNRVRVIDLKTYTVVDEFITDAYFIENITLDNNYKIKYILSSTGDTKINRFIINSNGEKLSDLGETGYGPGYFVNDDTYIVVDRTLGGEVSLIKTKKTDADFNYHVVTDAIFCPSPDKTLMLSFDQNSDAFHLVDFNLKTQIDISIDSFINNDKWGVVDFRTKKMGSTANFGNTAGAISKNNRLFAFGSDKGIIRIVDIPNRKELSRFIATRNGEWVAITPDGYWDGSINVGKKVNMINGMFSYGIDQFAPTNNRPDILLERIGSDDKELIAHYNRQVKKRFKKLGLDENQQNEGNHVPNALITQSNQNNKMLNLSIFLSDDKYKLKSYNVFINDVPLFGANGKSISKNSLKVNEKIELSSGTNKIEVSCINEMGVESYRDLAFERYDVPIKKDLYILAFGVSKYKNPTYNLAYADKDANDLAKAIESLKGKGYENVYTKVLTNEQVTPDAIKASKKFVKNAKPDDTFILYIAGHGMHDNDADATYYYLTSNADINNLKNTAADFETIEDLLQGVSPRNKLFLMDACESGEIDEEDQGQMLATATGAGISSRGFKKTNTLAEDGASKSSATNSTTKRSYLYQKDRYIYNDLARRSGAIVFSSSKGGELSYERSDIENGLFTENIMKALTTTEADKDANGTVSTDELREYVSTQVAIASGDLQHPTVDRDNIYQKFGFSLK